MVDEIFFRLESRHVRGFYVYVENVLAISLRIPQVFVRSTCKNFKRLGSGLVAACLHAGFSVSNVACLIWIFLLQPTTHVKCANSYCCVLPCFRSMPRPTNWKQICMNRSPLSMSK